MKFERICIIGTGLIGGSLALAFRRNQIGSFFTGVDRAETVAAVTEAGIFDQGLPIEQLNQAVKDADLIVLATPIQHILAILPQVAAHARPGCVVTDVGSTKGEITRLAEKVLPPEIYFIGGHPMAGSEKASFRAADPLLFENCFYILTPAKNTPEPVVQSFAAIIEKIGAKTLSLDAAEHDQIAAGISHLPQLLAVGLVNLIARYNQNNSYYLKMAAGGFRDMTRIASSPYSIWEDICNSNQQNIAEMMTELIGELEKLRDMFEQPELSTDKLGTIFDHAARTRLCIPKDTKGFINPLYDLRVAVEDKPGVIARMSAICFEHNINIRDIEVLKVRLLEGGTIRLSFDTEKDRQQATDLLQADGFECRVLE